jgi:hypothetical protein
VNHYSSKIVAIRERVPVSTGMSASWAFANIGLSRFSRLAQRSGRFVIFLVVAFSKVCSFGRPHWWTTFPLLLTSLARFWSSRSSLSCSHTTFGSRLFSTLLPRISFPARIYWVLGDIGQMRSKWLEHIYMQESLKGKASTTGLWLLIREQYPIALRWRRKEIKIVFSHLSRLEEYGVRNRR